MNNFQKIRSWILVSLGSFPIASTCALAADSTYNFSIPVDVKKMDPTIQKIGVSCDICAKGTIPNCATSVSQTKPLVNGAINATFTLTIKYPASKKPSDLYYNCNLIVDGNGYIGCDISIPSPSCKFPLTGTTKVSVQPLPNQ